MILSVNLQVSDPCRRTELAFELKIIRFVHREICLDHQTGFRMKKTACSFFHLTSISSSVPLVAKTKATKVREGHHDDLLKNLSFSRVAGDRILISWWSWMHSLCTQPGSRLLQRVNLLSHVCVQQGKLAPSVFVTNELPGKPS